MCVSKRTIIGSDNGLSLGRRQAVIWTNDGIFLIGPLGTNFSEILIEIHKFSFKKMHLRMSSGKLQPSCLYVFNTFQKYFSLHQNNFHEYTTQEPRCNDDTVSQSSSGIIIHTVTLVGLSTALSTMTGIKRCWFYMWTYSERTVPQKDMHFNQSDQVVIVPWVGGRICETKMEFIPELLLPETYRYVCNSIWMNLLMIHLICLVIAYPFN